jgi:Holliday junction DNA helicase RuvA
MFEFLKGTIVEKTPVYLILDVNNIGYNINISLNTYGELPDTGICTCFIHQVIREDAHILYGFGSKNERDIFRMLISVSGIGSNTARVILSSLSPVEVVQAIEDSDVITLQGIKGIGGKTAQRIIVDLKDKISKGVNTDELFNPERNTTRDEALSALVALGFAKKQVEKVVGNLLSQNPGITVEGIVKQALKLL